MTAEEIISSNLESVKRCREAYNEAMADNDFDRALRMARNILYYLVEAGMIQWRHQKCNPRPVFEDAFSIAKEAMELKHHPTEVPAWMSFEYTLGELVGYLVNPLGQNPPLERGFQFRTWKDAIVRRKPYALLNCLDMGLVESIETRIAPELWKEYLEYFRPKRKNALLLDSFDTYMEIVTLGGGAVIDYMPFVEKAAANFRKRVKDSVFKNTRLLEAGGEFNDLFVDLRLAAIMRVCLPDGGASVTGDAAIHVWRW
jgi:hypothetical protein